MCNLAARLCAEAKDGQILVSGRVARAVEAVARLEDLGNLELKGLRRPVAAFKRRAEHQSGGGSPQFDRRREGNRGFDPWITGRSQKQTRADQKMRLAWPSVSSANLALAPSPDCPPGCELGHPPDVKRGTRDTPTRSFAAARISASVRGNVTPRPRGT